MGSSIFCLLYILSLSLLFNLLSLPIYIYIYIYIKDIFNIASDGDYSAKSNPILTFSAFLSTSTFCKKELPLVHVI